MKQTLFINLSALICSILTKQNQQHMRRYSFYAFCVCTKLSFTHISLDTISKTFGKAIISIYLATLSIPTYQTDFCNDNVHWSCFNFLLFTIQAVVLENISPLTVQGFHLANIPACFSAQVLLSLVATKCSSIKCKDGDLKHYLGVDWFCCISNGACNCLQDIAGYLAIFQALAGAVLTR